MRANILLAPVLAATAFMVGCEWTSSDGISWDESYNNVNFSGTYNLSQNISSSSDDTTTPGGTYTKKYGNVSSGTVGTQVTVGSVQVTVYAKSGSAAFVDNGSGGLSNADFGEGSVSYASGAWSYPPTKLIAALGKIERVEVTYATSATTMPGNTTVLVNYVTVHQNGQNISLTFSNGYTFSGKISGFSTDSETIEHATSVIAKFSASGTYGTVTGTLNSLASSRQIDGVWSYRGKATAIVGSAIGPGRNISSNTTATEADD